MTLFHATPRSWMIFWLNCWIFLVGHVMTLSVKFDPIMMISTGTTHGTVVKIMKELLLTNEYEVLVQILKYPTYDFSDIYESSVCPFLAVDRVKVIINTLNFDDQIILLSDHCITKAQNVLRDIKVEEVALLPVNPMSSREFSPVLVAPVVFEALMMEALKNCSNEKSKPIDFYNWLTDPRFHAHYYFQDIPSMANMLPNVLNGSMFHGTYYKHQSWLLNLLIKRITDLINASVFKSFDRTYWIEFLKIFVVLTSIFNTVDPNVCPEDYAKSIQTYIKLLAKFCQEFSHLKADVFGLRILNVIKNFKTSTLSEVIQVLFDSGVDFHPDWLAGLLMCNMTATSEDYRNILLYISKRNPHYQTIETISIFMTLEGYSNVFKESGEFFKEELLLQNPDFILFRPLARRFRDLRSKLLPFTTFARHELIAGLLDAPGEPQELLRDIVNDFYEKHQFYTNEMTSILVTSFTKSGNVRFVDSLTMLHKALNAFLQLPEYYTVTSKDPDGRVQLIFNPFLPTKYIHIIMNLIIHLALLGGRIPFKIDKQYFKQCLKDLNDDLLEIYEDWSSDFEFMFLKISQVTDSNDWYTLPNHIYHVVEKYHEIVMLSDDLVRITEVPDKAGYWLYKSFIENSSALRIAVRSAFPFFQFSFMEIYYILFDK